MKFFVTFRPNWWIIGAIFEEICIYVEENEGFGQPLIPFILLIGELQMGPYMVTYWCVSECCSLIGSYHLYVYRNGSRRFSKNYVHPRFPPPNCHGCLNLLSFHRFSRLSQIVTTISIMDHIRTPKVRHFALSFALYLFTCIVQP